MKKQTLVVQSVLLVLSGLALLFLGYELVTTPESRNENHGVVRVVAAENFWGSIASQIGGVHVHVMSLVTDPNADPHEYSSSVSTAQSVATADYIIENGAGYDSWMDKLVDASHNNSRKVFTVAKLLGKKNGDNPHFWYNPTYVNQVSREVMRNLSDLDPANAQYYQTQYTILQNKLAGYQQQLELIKQRYGGVKVAATEDIFAYLANATGLDLVSPLDFTRAVAEGNDPTSGSVALFQQQLVSGKVELFVFNNQTETPLTNEMKSIAAANHIPIVGITETMQPVDGVFQDWMMNETVSIKQALGQSSDK